MKQLLGESFCLHATVILSKICYEKEKKIAIGLIIIHKRAIS